VTRYRFFTNGSESSVLNAIATTNHSSVPSRIRSSMIFPDDGEDDAPESKGSSRSSDHLPSSRARPHLQLVPTPIERSAS